ncbi:uncharacterized protein VP01_119g17 [Puccinia sorghi]|uniref:Uncharacterized protein n=1 Tax=Puccinia sorghi TaxID=27349 RepID=A0A0L6VQP4_9BASI|nr:uncharacterized protein VP01_119g17 [Puccinia sorghi]
MTREVKSRLNEVEGKALEPVPHLTKLITEVYSYGPLHEEPNSPGNKFQSQHHGSSKDLARLWDRLTTSTHLIETVYNDAGGTAASAGTIPQHRVLIFCQIKQMLDNIEHNPFKLEIPNVTYIYSQLRIPEGLHTDRVEAIKASAAVAANPMLPEVVIDAA